MNENVSLCARASLRVCLFELDSNGCLLVCTAAALNISLQTPFGIRPGERVHVLSVAEQTAAHNNRQCTWASERCTRNRHSGGCVPGVRRRWWHLLWYVKYTVHWDMRGGTELKRGGCLCDLILLC